MDLLEMTQEFFFRGMEKRLAAQVDNREGIFVWAEPGMFEDFLLLANWNTNAATRRFCDHIVISHRAVDVWEMTREGEPYEDGARPTVREALMSAYRKKQFFGGRGPLRYKKDDMEYENALLGGSYMGRFQGFENIFDVDEQRFLGTHAYWGGSLQ